MVGMWPRSTSSFSQPGPRAHPFRKWQNRPRSSSRFQMMDIQVGSAWGAPAEWRCRKMKAKRTWQSGIDAIGELFVARATIEAKVKATTKGRQKQKTRREPGRGRVAGLSRPRGYSTLARLVLSDRGAETAEYAIATMAAVGFAGLLVVILKGDEVREILTNLVRDALTP